MSDEDFCSLSPPPSSVNDTGKAGQKKFSFSGIQMWEETDEEYN